MGGSSPGVNPFVGPRPLETGERLFGRDRELAELSQLLGAERIVLLHSPSGAGKSSLIHAGLIPRLRERFDVWRPTRVGHPPPADAPADTNRYALSAMLGFEQGIPEAMRRPTAELARLRLDDYVAGRPRRRGAPASVLLVFDQFEEVLTAAPLAIAAKQAFFAQLGELLRDPAIWALFSLREDYLAPLDPYARQVPTHLRNRCRIDLLDRTAAREAIVGPAVGRAWTEAAAERLICDLATVKVQQADGRFVEQAGLYVEPMQLQVVCRGLWERMAPDDPTIELEDVARFGDVTAALGVYYAAEVQKIAAGQEATERAVRGWVGEKLITAGGIRCPVLRTPEASEGLANELIARLVDAHLVRAEHRGGATWYELAHDRLVEPVRQDNARWAETHLQPVQVQAALWARQGKPAGLLLSDEALAAAEAWVAGSSEPLGEPDRSFLAASRAARAQEREVREAQARAIEALSRAMTAAQELAEAKARAAARQRRLTWIVGLLGVVSTLAAGVSLWLYREAHEQRADAIRATEKAQRARDGARDATWIAYSRRFRGSDPARALAGLANVRDVATLGWLQDALELLQRPNVVTTATGTVAGFSPDGGRFVAGGGDGAVRVADADGSGAPVDLGAHAAMVRSASFSGDGRWIVTASDDGTARVWSAERPGESIVLRGHESGVMVASFAPDGRRVVTASADATARVWDVERPGEPVVLRGHASLVASARFTADGLRIVTASWDGTARVWDAGGAGEPRVLLGHEGEVYSASFSPDDRRIVTASKDRTARVWRADGPGEPVVLRGHAAEVWSAHFSADGERVVTASRDRTARVWDAGGAQSRVLAGHQGSVMSASFSADGRRIVTAADDDTVRVWDVDPAEEPVILAGGGAATAMASASFSPDGRRVLTASADDTVRVWDFDGPGVPQILRGHTDEVTSESFSPDGRRIVTASRDGTARVWAVDGSGESVVLGHEGAVRSASFSADGRRIVTASEDGTARVWSVDGGGASNVLRGHAGAVVSAAFSADGRRIVTASADRTARVWSADGSGEPVVLRGHEGWVLSASFDPGGRRIVTASEDRMARVWDADGRGEPVVLRGHEDRVLSAHFSPDGRRVVTTSPDRTARVWDADGGGEPVVLRHEGWVDSAMFSADGRRIVTASEDETARVWSADGSGEPVVLRGHEGWVDSARFSPDGRWIATASADGTARLWDAEGSGESLILRGHRDKVRSASFGPDGRHVVTSSADRTARVWIVDPALLRARVVAAATLCVSAEERVQYGELADEACKAFTACEREHERSGECVRTRSKSGGRGQRRRDPPK